MSYNVKITDYAIEQMQNVTNYISKTLQEPGIAREWLAHLQQEISKLDIMPKRFSLVEEEPWRTKGIHKIPIDNFIIYYWIDESDKVVWVIAVIYGRRDQLSILHTIPQQKNE